MVLRPFLHSPGSCASYVFGCTTHHTLAVVDPYVEHVALSDAEVVELDGFTAALLAESPPRPANQDQIVAANRSGRVPTRM